ncbi:MAG TPA: M15 family metallopeptidase [Burkholderiales bacterium]|nr:M15 family metallopeptidase [Burkholderiales bacterium]
MKRVSDPAELLPPFRRAVEQLLERMRARGFSPTLHETYRTPERSKALVKAGTSRVHGLSMHCYRIAADVICGAHGWDCEKNGCTFYTRLGFEASRLGLTWGGNWDGDGVTREQREHDLPHVQGVPLAVQNRVRQAPVADLEELLSEYLRAS